MGVASALTLKKDLAKAPSSQAIGVLKSMMDTYVQKYKTEADDWKPMEEKMDKLADASAGDQEAQVSAIDEKQRMRNTHEKAQQSNVSFIKTLEGAVHALQPNWLNDFPELE